MSSDVIVNIKPTSEIIANLGLQEGGPAHSFFTHQCSEHMDKYTPYRDGFLSSTNKETGVDYIYYKSAYAHYMYEGKVMGPNIPIKRNGYIVGWWSKAPKHYTGKDIDYSKSQAQPGHEYAGPHWDKRMWSAEKDEIVEEVAEFIKKFGGTK